MTFETIIPMEAGIPAQAIINYLNELEQNNINLHSFMMLHKGKIIAEGYWKPFHKNFLHRMFSVSKSFTALAIGLLEEEGKIRITDKICDYFKDKLPSGGAHPWILEMTIRDMLCMTTAHQTTTYKRYEGKDWVESFFCVEPSHQPGTIFSYDTSASHVLAALVERLTDMSLLDYLRSKFLDELGFSKEAYWLKDPFGVTQGGTGLVCTMRDVAKVAWLCTNGGRYADKQLLPKEFLEQAIKKQVDTSLQPHLDEQQGYGFQIWQSRNGGFCFYGLGGQLAVCFPQYEFVYVTTADTIGQPANLQQIYEAFYKQVFPYVKKSETGLLKKSEEEFAAEKELLLRLNNLEKKPLLGLRNQTLEGRIHNQKYTFHKNSIGIQQATFAFSGKEGSITLLRNGEAEIIRFGMGDFYYSNFPITCYPCMSSGAWVSEDTLLLQISLIGENIGTLKLSACFKESQVTLCIKAMMDDILKDYAGITTGSCI